MTSNKSTSMVTFLVIMFAMLVSFSECSNKKKISGNEYIDREVLVNILMDIHLMDGITNDMKYYRKYNPDDSIDYYTPIFKKYGVDREKYDRTIDEYSKYPQLLDEVYDEVLMKLTLLQDRIENEEDEKKELIRDKNP